MLYGILYIQLGKAQMPVPQPNTNTMKTMIVQSKFSPIKGEEVIAKVYKSFFKRNAGTPEALLRAHLHAAVDAFPDRSEEFLDFYRGELEAWVLESVSRETENAAYIMGRKACFMGEQEFPTTLPKEWRDSWTRGHDDFQVWEAGINAS